MTSVAANNLQGVPARIAPLEYSSYLRDSTELVA